MSVAKYFKIALELYSIELISRAKKLIQNEFLLVGIEDQDQEVRKQTRVCFVAYANMSEFKAEALDLAISVQTSARK